MRLNVPLTGCRPTRRRLTNHQKPLARRSLQHRDTLSEKDLVNYAHTVCDKIRENELVMRQIANNSDEQAILDHLPQAMDEAIMGSSAAHQNQMFQLLGKAKRQRASASGFSRCSRM